MQAVRSEQQSIDALLTAGDTGDGCLGKGAYSL